MKCRYWLVLTSALTLLVVFTGCASAIKTMPETEKETECSTKEESGCNQRLQRIPHRSEI